MAVIAPQTDVYLLKVPLEIDNTNQLTFANATAQFNYFNSLPKLPFDNFTYQRKDGVIRIPALIDDIIQYNYVMYRNEGFSNKWFYAYIDKMEYLNDGVTAVSITTDVWQTWQFDLTYKTTFVEREHVNDDTIGLHTVPENLELGEYEIVDVKNSPLYVSSGSDHTNDFVPCFCVSKIANDTNSMNGENNEIGNVFTSLHFFAVSNFSDAKTVIEIYEKRGDVSANDIVNIYMIPRNLVNFIADPSGIFVLGPPTITCQIYPLFTSLTSDEYTLQAPAVLAENYVPVNNKLLTHPYSYFYVTNNCGEDIEYKYEDFPLETVGQYTRRTMHYKKAYVPSTSVSAKLYFTHYKNWAEGNESKLYNYGVNFAKIPVCAWTTDYYTNWLTQNGVNVGVDVFAGVAGGLAGAIGGAATANPMAMVSGVTSLASTIGGTIGKMQQVRTTPWRAQGDINTGDLMYAYTRNSIKFYYMSIRPEYARIIDQYFSAFGYKVNTVKIPNITGRRNWNYVKTIGCYIEADIPQDDLQAIKDMFNNGVTFWHNANTFADYTQNNDII